MKLTVEQISKLEDLASNVIWARADEETCISTLKQFYSERTLRAWDAFNAYAFSIGDLTSGQYDELIAYIFEGTKKQIAFNKASAELCKAKRDIKELLAK